MVDLQTRQQQLWTILNHLTDKPPMLRLCREDDCFWICDLPRRLGAVAAAEKATYLQAQGYVILPDDGHGLWRIDLPMDDSLFSLYGGALSLPTGESLHQLYALYRLLAAHPAPVQLQPMGLVRAILKLLLLPKSEQKQRTEQLYSCCAALLNQRKPLPSAACYALAQYILQEDLP